MRNYIPSLFFILLFPIALLAQPPCGGNNPAGPSPAIFIDSQIGSSFTATASCEGVLDEVEVRAGLFGSPLSAELRIYDGLIGSGGTLVFTQPFTLTSGNNMIDLVSTEGNPAPCLEDGDQYTFTIASANLFFLWGFNANNYAGGASYTSFGGYNAAKDLWFSFTAVEPGEIDLTGLGNSIPNGDVTPDVADDTDFGIVEVGNTPVHTFTIHNIGAGDLHLTGVPEVQLSGDPEFTVSSQPAGGTLMNAETQDFDITFTPVSDGVVSTATVTIHSSDCDEDTYTFVIQGEGFICDDPDVPTLSASANNVCPETDVTLSVLSGNLNDASDWVWYDDVCGGNQVGTGLSIQVSPLSTTTYYVRGEGGCIVPGTCGDITLVVDDNEDPGITCPDPITLQADANCEVLIPDLTLLDGEVLANSAADFSGTQGQDGWSYGYYAPNDPDGFTQLDPLNFNMNIWMGVQTGGTPSLDSNGGEPGIDDGVWAVRRWVSDYTGQVTISGMYFDRDLNCGDGSNVRIFHNGTQVFLAFSIPGTTTNYTIDLQVGVGDQLDFIIDPLFDTACDDTELTTEITVNSGLMISDNCSLDDVAITQNPLAGTPAGPGVTSVELTATDGFGNTATCNVDLTIEDNIDPTALCQDATVTLDATGNGSVSAAQIDDGSNDGCGIASLSLDETAFDCSEVGANTVTLTVEDNNGNTSTCIATVTVEDTTDPEALCQDATVTLDAAGNGSISAAQIDNGSNDACGIASLSLDETAFDCSEVGANTVTLTVEDNNGNTSTCMATVTVEDTTDPQALCQDVTVTLDAAGNGSTTAAQIDNGSNDACGIAGLSLDETAFDCSEVGANTVTLTVEDNNGNTSTCTATVTVEDTTDPEALCQDATVTLDATGNGSITAAQIDNGSNDACGILSLSLDETAFDCSEVGANTVTLTVEDNNGNTSTCTATVTVEDTTDPEALCQDIILALDANGFGAISAMQIDNGSNDACGVASLSVFPYSFDCSNIGDNIVTLTVTDDNWNMSTCTATVTVEDITNPDAICQDITVTLDNTGNATITAAQVDGGSFDACGIAEFSVDPAAFNCSNVGANTVTLTVTDVYWNESTCTATVTVEDDTNPEALCQDATVTLDASGNGSISAAQIDNGSNDACGILSLSLDETAFDCSDVGVNAVLLTVEDNNGNTSTCSATVTVEDTTDPQALCQDITIALNPSGNASISAAQIDNGSNDACGIASLSLDQTAFDCSDVGVNAVLLTVEDNNGNTSTCAATVTVEDTTDPQALCQDATVTLDASGNGSISAAQIDNGSNDACGIASLSLDQTAFDCSDVGVNAVLLTVTDNNGNTSTCSATVTVEDDTNPEALCQDATVTLDASGNGSISAAQIDNGSNDACGILSLSLDQTAFDCSDVGINAVLLTVEDNHGNTSTCSATVTVEDTTDPEALCQDITIALDPSGNASISAAQIDNGSNDACGILSLSLDETAFDCSEVGANTVTLTVEDNNGNTSTCTATVTVEDTTDPEALCQDITIALDPSGNASITAAQIDNGSNDACGILSLSLDETAFDCSEVGANTVTLTVEDNNGNTSTCTATVTVEDTTDPQALCQDATITLDATGNGSVTAAQIDNGSNDACGIAGLSLDETAFDCSEVGANSVTLTVTDNNGNTSTCTATVTVEDITDPQALCQDATVTLDATGNGSITAAQIDDGSNDACGIASLSLDETAFDCSEVGANTVTLTVTDNNGNTSTCTATVTVEDTTDPQALCQDITIALDPSGNASITAAQIDNGSNDACGIASLSLDETAFDCSEVGANTVTLTVTDNNGNTSTCAATVTVEDTTDPQALCQDITIALDPSGNASITAAQIDDGSNDACGIASLSLDETAFDCSEVGANTVTLTVTDNNGNTSTCTATVIVEDNTGPFALCQDVTIVLDLGGNGSITAGQIDDGSNDACGIGSMMLDQTAFDCSDVGVNAVLLTVTDNNGNTSACTGAVTVIASLACPIPLISNYGGPHIGDPCTCLGDGKFAEEIVIGPTLPGLIWELSQNSGLLDPNTLLPFAIGTDFTEVSIGVGVSIYVLEGVHLDGIGYNIEAESPFYPGITLSIGNLCYYPDPVITGLADEYCQNSNPVVLEGNAGGVALVSESFTIDGNPAVIFNPAVLNGGVHIVTYTVDAGTAGSFDPSDPGCVASVSQAVEIVGTSPNLMACNDLVAVSVDENCEALIVGDMVLEGDYYCYGDFQVDIYYNLNQIPNPITYQYVGLTLDYTAINLNTGNECSGQLIVQDLLEPTLSCNADPIEIGCNEDLSTVPPPDADDNCSVASVELVSMTYLDTDACDDGTVVVEQTWIAVDIYGNISEPCTRLIIIHRTDNDLVDFPNDITWECTQYMQFPNIIAAEPLHPNILNSQNGVDPLNATTFGNQAWLALSGSGVPGGVQGTYCGYGFTFTQVQTPLCGNSFQIIRTWTVLDECTGEVITGNVFGEDNIQVIRVVDITPPVVTVPDFTLSAAIPGSGPGTCKSQGLLPPPMVTDDCNEWDIRIFTPIGEAIYLPNGWGAVPPPGLPLGTHVITYQVMDACGNTTTLGIEVDVIDDIAPTAICDEITDVNLSSDGLAVVNALTFDDGSFDNCCIDGLLVRRLDGDCDGNFDDFDPTVTFCCTDVANNPIIVIMQVTDCYGNTNECEVEVMVNDKIDPILVSCPPTASISCELYNATYMMPLSLGNNSVLDDFGTAVFFDNCLPTLNVDYQVNVNIDNCGQGTITRSWVATDDNGNGPVYCTQSILVYHESDWVVEFPEDVTVQCTDGSLPGIGEPEIFFDDCEMIAVTFEDQIFTIVPDACYKIARTWTVINWCVYDQFGSDVYPEAGKAESNLNVDWDGDGDKDPRTFRDGWNSSGSPGYADGYISYKQIIKVMDNEDPQFMVPPIDGCILDADCNTDIVLPYPIILDECSPSFEVDLSGDFGFYPGISGPVTVPDVEVGTYTVFYAVRDNCGNTSYQNITVVVEDCLLPKVKCEALVVEIMQTGMIEVAASELDAGSFDNCGPVEFSFTPDTDDETMIFTCNDIGPNEMEMWVTDVYGNQDFCEVLIVVQDNMGWCNQQNAPSVAGWITTEDDEMLEGVMVEVNGGNWSQMTNSYGQFTFNLPSGGDYSVAPLLDEDADNGVTTFDMVLIQRHILGVSLLSSPYKIIAADANKSATVTTLDLVAIRKVILVLTDYFPNNTSWRFVDVEHSFDNPQDPFTEPIPEVINFNNLLTGNPDANFMAIKVGDVNGSATMDAQQGAEDRDLVGSLEFQLQEQALKAGNTYEVPFHGDDQEVFGYQFTLELGPGIKLLEVKEGIAREENFGFALLDEGALTTSWNEAMPRRLGREEVIFSLVLQAGEDALLSEVLGVSSRFTAAEAYNPLGELLDIGLAFAPQPEETGGFELYQNVPNPFREATTIRFRLPHATQANLTVTDASGRVVYVQRGEYGKGTHEVKLEGLEGVTGVLYYRLETPDYTMTKKMIKIE